MEKAKQFFKKYLFQHKRCLVSNKKLMRSKERYCRIFRFQVNGREAGRDEKRMSPPPPSPSLHRREGREKGDLIHVFGLREN